MSNDNTQWIEPPQGMVTIDELESFFTACYEGRVKSVHKILNDGHPYFEWAGLSGKEKQAELDRFFKPMRDYLPDAGMVIEAYTNEDGIFQIKYVKKEMK